MNDTSLRAAPVPTEPLLVGDHLALDLLNTEAVAGAALHDFWQTDEDVARWLGRCGIAPGDAASEPGKAPLLERARALRALARELVGIRKLGGHGDPAPLNGYLSALRSAPVLHWDAAGPRLARETAPPSPSTALGMVAESVASLLAEGNFELVRQCEHPDCVLWFYDRTKSHRRRWCSMAVCGNRHKAAEYRRRNADTVP